MVESVNPQQNVGLGGLVSKSVSFSPQYNRKPPTLRGLFFRHCGDVGAGGYPTGGGLGVSGGRWLEKIFPKLVVNNGDLSHGRR